VGGKTILYLVLFLRRCKALNL